MMLVLKLEQGSRTLVINPEHYSCNFKFTTSTFYIELTKKVEDHIKHFMKVYNNPYLCIEYANSQAYITYIYQFELLNIKAERVHIYNPFLVSCYDDGTNFDFNELYNMNEHELYKLDIFKDIAIIAKQFEDYARENQK
jgi:hypothetical protein